MRIALLGTYTLDLFRDALVSRLRNFYGLPSVEVYNAGFNQVVQEVLDDNSGLYPFDPGYVVFIADFEDLVPEDLRYSLKPKDASAVAEGIFGPYEKLVRRIRERLPKANVFFLTAVVPPRSVFPGQEYNTDSGLKGIQDEFNARLKRLAQSDRRFTCIDYADLVMETGFERWFDPRLWYLAKMRLSPAAAESLAERVGSFLTASRGLTRKCLALDLDNTLWGGVAGEDAPEKIRLDVDGPGAAFHDFQKALLRLSRKGILLAVCSKNYPEFSMEIIEKHPRMVLRKDDFAAIRINWENKSDNLRSIARELNIGLDSFVFLDDNPREREEIRKILPEVAVPELPSDPVYYAGFLKKVEWNYFNLLSITEDDLRRTRQYREQSARREEEGKFGSLEAFYHSLDIRVSVVRLAKGSPNVERVSQLTQKTNQFNLTTRRYSIPEIAGMLDREDRVGVYYLEMRDKFGDYGIVGVIILKDTDGRTLIDTFLLSCRVIGKKAENVFLSCALRDWGRTGEVEGVFIPSAKNRLVSGLYPGLGFVPSSGPGDGSAAYVLKKDGLIFDPPWVKVISPEDKPHA